MPGIAQTPGAHTCYGETLSRRGIRSSGAGHYPSPLLGGKAGDPALPSSGDLTVCHLMAVGHTMVARAMVWLSISKPSRAPLVVAPSPVLGSFRAVTVM